MLKHTAKLDPAVPSVKDLGFFVNYTVYANTALQKGNTSNTSSITLEPVYTVRSLLLSPAGVPFYYAAIFFSASPAVIVGLFVNSLFISLTAIIIFCICIEFSVRTRSLLLPASYTAFVPSYGLTMLHFGYNLCKAFCWSLRHISFS